MAANSLSKYRMRLGACVMPSIVNTASALALTLALTNSPPAAAAGQGPELVLASMIGLFQENDDDFDDDVDQDTDFDDFDAFDDEDVDGDDEEQEDGEEDDEDDDNDYDDDDDDDETEELEDLIGLNAQDIDFDGRGFPARSREVLAFDLDADDLAIARDLGFVLIEKRQLAALDASVDRLRVPAELDLGDAVNALEGALPAAPFDYNHIYILPDSRLPPMETGNVTPLGAPQSGEGIRLGVIDTLPDTAHPSLRGQSVIVRDFAEPGRRETAHATAVISILVGSDFSADYQGLIPGAKIYAANIFSLNRNGLPSTDAMSMLEALNWLATEDVGVINMSIAGPRSKLVADAIRRLKERGHLVVAAVGNDGPAAPPLFPASHQGVTGVTAIDLEGNVYRRAGRGPHVDFSAPGVRVMAAAENGGYAPVTGTSFATPVIAALMARAYPRPGQGDTTLQNSIRRSVRDLGPSGRDDIFGHGLLLPGN